MADVNHIDQKEPFTLLSLPRSEATKQSPVFCHCEERSDEVIPRFLLLRGAKRRSNHLHPLSLQGANAVSDEAISYIKT